MRKVLTATSIQLNLRCLGRKRLDVILTLTVDAFSLKQVHGEGEKKIRNAIKSPGKNGETRLRTVLYSEMTLAAKSGS